MATEKITNLRRKKLHPRRKFHCDAAHRQWIGATVWFEGEDHPLVNLSVRQDGRPNNGRTAQQNARELVAAFRARCPRAEIHIRRGAHVVVKAYNEYDSALLWDFCTQVEKARGAYVPPYQFYPKSK